MDDQQQDDGMDEDFYPPDPEDFDGTEDAPGMHVPQPRAAQVKRPLHNASKRRTKTAKQVGKRSSRILAQQKRRQALEGRKAGLTYQQIADSVGYTDASAAHKAVMKAFGEVIQEPVNELKTIQIERLNHMLVALWGRVQQGDERAISTALMVMNKMDALMGTDAAQRIEVKKTDAVLIVDGDKDDYIAALRKMSGAGIGPDGQNISAPQPGAAVQALPPGRNYPPGMAPTSTAVLDEDVVEAEIVEEDAALLDAVDEHNHQAPSMETKKKYRFGVDPTVKRDAGQ